MYVFYDTNILSFANRILTSKIDPKKLQQRYESLKKSIKEAIKLGENSVHICFISKNILYIQKVCTKNKTKRKKSQENHGKFYKQNIKQTSKQTLHFKLILHYILVVIVTILIACIISSLFC